MLKASFPRVDQYDELLHLSNVNSLQTWGRHQVRRSGLASYLDKVLFLCITSKELDSQRWLITCAGLNCRVYIACLLPSLVRGPQHVLPIIDYSASFATLRSSCGPHLLRRMYPYFLLT